MQDIKQKRQPGAAERGGEHQQASLWAAPPADDDESGQPQVGQRRQAITDGGQEQQDVGHDRLRGAGLAHALSPQHHLRGLEQDHEIEKQAVILDVIEVELQLVHRVFISCAIRVAHLRPAGDAGFDRVAHPVIGNFLCQVLHEIGALWAWADEAHVAEEHVENLRQFVDAGASDEAPGERHAAVILPCSERLAVFFGVDAHAAEFEDGEIAAPLADALLAVQHGAGAFQLDEQGGHSHEWQADDQHRRAYQQVEQALGGVAQHALVKALGQDHPAGVHRVDLQMSVFALEKAGQFQHANPLQLALEQLLDRRAAPAIAHGENDFSDLQACNQFGQGLPGVENTGMVDEMVTAAHWKIAQHVDIAGVTASGQQCFDVGGTAAGADHQGAGLERARPHPADEQGAAEQNAKQREAERQEEGAPSDQQDGKEIEQQAHRQKAESETQAETLQQRPYAALRFQIIEAAGGHQPQHDDSEGQGLGQQRLQVRGNHPAVVKAGADPGINRAAENHRLDQHQQQ